MQFWSLQLKQKRRMHQEKKHISLRIMTKNTIIVIEVLKIR